MAKYRITSQTSGADLGTYEAASPDAALDAMAREAGYTDQAAACEASGDDGAHLVVTPVKQRTITLTDASPIKINEETWPVIAEGEDYPGQYDFQAFDLAWIKVRRHDDGRTIVYGGAGDGHGGGRPEREERRAGYLLPSPDRTVETIRQVADELSETEYCDGLAIAAGRRCIADLPAEVLS